MDDLFENLYAAKAEGPRETVSGDPIARLLFEHRIIADAACALESWSIWAEQGYGLNRECMETLVRFLVEFVEDIHHQKEETVLMPFLIAAGLLPSEGVSGQLETEHHQERYLVGELRRLVADVGAGAPLGSGHFISLARELVSFQKRHLESESREVYSVIERLASQERQQLCLELREFDLRAPWVLKPWRSILRWLLDPSNVLERPRNAISLPELHELGQL